jgi:hypothetical protein
VRGRAAFWAAAGVALLASHDAVFIAQDGPDAGLAQVVLGAAHEYWTPASLILLAIGVVVAIAANRRLRALRWRARTLGAAPLRAAPFGRRAVRAGALLFAVVAIGFLLQENAEHYIAHGHLIGLGALIGPEYPLALPVIAVMTAVGGVVVGLFGGAVERLAVAIAEALANLRHRPQRRISLGTIALVLPREPVLARAGAGRAPPTLARS